MRCKLFEMVIYFENVYSPFYVMCAFLFVCMAPYSVKVRRKGKIPGAEVMGNCEPHPPHVGARN